MSRRIFRMSLVLLAGMVLGCDDGATPPATPPVAAQPEPAPAAPVVAEAGVGKRGQSLKNEKGVGRMIAQPAITLFAVEQRMVFDVQIPQALKLYEATNGAGPKTHDEFMKQIIQANQIRLPELPAGQVYKYHPDEKLLYVHPASE